MTWEPIHNCDSCGTPWGVAKVWEGYVTPYPDVAPTYREWEELWLCRECEALRHPKPDFKLTPPPDDTPPDEKCPF
jgi:hypothetical protein